MESKKLEKPCENATFQALQGVMKPDEETGGVFPTMQHVSVALRIPKYCYYFPIALSSVMMFCMYLADTIEFVKEWMNEGKEVQKI